jgi:hypothetical protein
VRTLAVAALVSAVTAVTVIEAVRTWRRRPERLRPLAVAWMLLGTCIWLFGGLLTALLGLLSGEECSGTGGLSSFGCLNRPGQGLLSVGWLPTLSTTGVLAVMYWSGRRSWLVATLAPALIIGLYVLAAALWQPHTGFGVPHRHVMP